MSADIKKLRKIAQAALPLDCTHAPGCELCPVNYPADMAFRRKFAPHVILDLLTELESTLGRAKNAESIMCKLGDERDDKNQKLCKARDARDALKAAARALLHLLVGSHAWRPEAKALEELL